MTDEEPLVVERLVRASPQAIFRYFTDPCVGRLAVVAEGGGPGRDPQRDEGNPLLRHHRSMDREERGTTDEGSAAPASTLIDHIHRVDLRVQDVERAVAFYRDVAGLEVVLQEGDRASLGAPGGEPFLVLDAGGVGAPASRRAPGLFHTAIRYPDRRALADGLARLVEAGERIGAGDHGVSEALYVDDPDGNGVELYRDRPTDEWPEPAPGQRVQMGTAPVDLDDLLGESTGRGPRTRAPAGTGIGHVHFQVSDLRRTVPFYVDGLGLDLMMMLADQAAFLSSNGYHHHIGANIWNSRGQTPVSRDHAGLDRVVFYVQDPDDLARARERLAAIAHHGTGDDTELVVHDPDGIELRWITRSR